MKNIVVLIILAALCGCAANATGPLFKDTAYSSSSIEDQKARIYIFRKDAGIHAKIRSARIRFDDETVGHCDINGFFSLDVSPGLHTIATDLPDTAGQCAISVDYKSGEKYFYEVKPNDLNGATAAAGFMLGMIGGAIADNIENSGKQCGGGFAINEVRPEAGIRELESMRLTQ